MTQRRVTHRGGPTTLLEIDGWRDDVPQPKWQERPLRSSLSSLECDAVRRRPQTPASSRSLTVSRVSAM